MALTDEQLRLIEQKRQNALKIRQQKQMQTQRSTVTSSNGHSSIMNPWSLSTKSNVTLPSSSSQNGSPIRNELKKVDVKLLLQSKNRVSLHFPFDRDILNAVKQIPTSIYIPETKIWTFDISVYREIIETLSGLKKLNIKIEFSDRVPSSVIVALKQQRTQSEMNIDLSQKLNAKFISDMYDFQKEGVQFGISRNGRVLIADDMGLGKTVQALALSCWYREDWPLLIMCPSSLRYQWRKSILFWVDGVKEHHVAVVDKANMDVSQSCIVIISYDLLTRFKTKLDSKFQFVIADESHYIKSDSAQRTKNAVKIMKSAKRLVLLSGTPALSRPLELFTQINALDSRIFASKTDFGFRYCNGRTTKWGNDFRGASNEVELKILLESTIMIRRLKKDVLDQLPTKRRVKVVLPIVFKDKDETKMNSYSSQIAGMKDSKGSNMYKQVLFNWFNLTAEVKVTAVCEYVHHLVEQGKKFILFAHHRIMIETVCEMLERDDCSYIRIDGTTPAKIRLECCDYFQENEDCKVAVISIVAASVGINLTAAHLVVFAELFWNPGILTQAEDRAHRIGQNDSVLIQYLVSPQTVDDFIWPMVVRKFKVLNDVGLSKDSFKDTGITDVNQKLIDDFFSALPRESLSASPLSL
ncbi:SWI/SNF subfamily A-like protein [Leptotrombidium deliense]|uniref:SWI/SNF subfamily A-like protein n=1 Tax=Leptotrombidium deliense TaxID=299467 RepID=A0A443SCH2_9ACAR|nr:SWI/SNF subfamily A-like protein [Leptotrombidium deliense]